MEKEGEVQQGELDPVPQLVLSIGEAEEEREEGVRDAVHRLVLEYRRDARDAAFCDRLGDPRSIIVVPFSVCRNINKRYVAALLLSVRGQSVVRIDVDDGMHCEAHFFFFYKY